MISITLMAHYVSRKAMIGVRYVGRAEKGGLNHLLVP